MMGGIEAVGHVVAILCSLGIYVYDPLRNDSTEVNWHRKNLSEVVDSPQLLRSLLNLPAPAHSYHYIENTISRIDLLLRPMQRGISSASLGLNRPLKIPDTSSSILPAQGPLTCLSRAVANPSPLVLVACSVIFPFVGAELYNCSQRKRNGYASRPWFPSYQSLVLIWLITLSTIVGLLSIGGISLEDVRMTWLLQSIPLLLEFALLAATTTDAFYRFLRWLASGVYGTARTEAENERDQYFGEKDQVPTCLTEEEV